MSFREWEKDEEKEKRKEGLLTGAKRRQDVEMTMTAFRVGDGEKISR